MGQGRLKRQAILNELDNGWLLKMYFFNTESHSVVEYFFPSLSLALLKLESEDTNDKKEE